MHKSAKTPFLEMAHHAPLMAHRKIIRRATTVLALRGVSSATMAHSIPEHYRNVKVYPSFRPFWANLLGIYMSYVMAHSVSMRP
jgi:hypothetical protein